MDKNLENIDPWSINFDELDDAGVRVIPTNEELADMKVQAWYDSMNDNMQLWYKAMGIDETDRNFDKKTFYSNLKSDLTELSYLASNGFIDKHLPIAEYTNGETISGEDAKDITFDKLSFMLCEEFGSYNDRNDPEFESQKTVENKLLNGDVSVFCNVLDSQISNIDYAEEDALIKRADKFEYSGVYDIGNITDIKTVLDNKIKANSKLTISDIDYINNCILDEYESINDTHESDALDSKSFEQALQSQAIMCENIRNKYGIDLDAKEIPAFVESEIGSDRTPDEMRKEAELIIKESEKSYADDLENFYKNVHELDNYDTIKLSNNDRRPVLITMATRDALGKGYEDYCEKSVQDLANNLASKYCMGIDTTKVAKTISNEVSAPLEKSNAKVLPTEFEDLYQESVENGEPIEDDTQENPNGDGNFNQ